MEINILQEYTSLEEMSVKELLKEWPRYFDTPPKTKSNKKYLVNELIYRVQELAYGGLTKKTIDRLEALAESKSLNERKYDNTRLAIGTHLIREVKGVEHHVTVLEDGYEYQGTKYKSLSGAAFAITGTRWNGNAFFGLLKNKATRPYHKSRGRK
ncbi:MAG: hypothetical protein CBB87_01110 [Micavibrio sp. TMED27]|nr:hypothetical protein [Micavibrio sp.]OUT92370.1 MAG: hypothetical protein CBB87_01110 [Micavibrio sp. TMED27]|tara:strand:- start:348 stop:812 length:465 start_codon:yes stop_codon:yes gene_type:complete